MMFEKFFRLGKKKRKVKVKSIKIGEDVFEVCSEGEFIDSKDSAIITFYKGKDFKDALYLKRRSHEEQKD